MRVKGLDTLRFILAMIVVIGHIGFDFTELSQLPLLKNGLGIVNNMFCGIACVIAFFIISGFCIHFPYAQGKKIKPLEFEIKRFIRIAIPAVIAMFFFYMLTASMLGVIWSLVCELVYYVFYPLLLNIINKNGNTLKKHFYIFVILLFFSLVTSVSYDFFNTQYNGDFHRSGYLLTWIVGFPVWYLGVILAEFYVRDVKIKFLYIKFINYYRIFIYGLTIICSIARFHFHAAYVYSLILFAIPVFFWIYMELMYYNTKKENILLENGGMMSYSIYIFHMSVFELLLLTNDYLSIQSFQNNVLFVGVVIIATILLSFIFYRFFEKPSHKLAQRIKLDIP